MPDLIGQSLGRYHIMEQLGEGGMATVYKAYDTRLERDVAVKIIRRDAFPPSQLERILKRFEREAKALARLSHPNIVKVHDYGDYDGAPYLVLEYLPGGTLKARLGRRMPYQDAAHILLPIARALDYAHRQNIVHRDVKPANILITDSGEPMLSDFGIAKILESEEAATLTGTGIGVGTPEYMAPEQWTGQPTAQSDIYSLAVVFYELVAGRKPYTADTPGAILLKQATEPLPRPSRFVPGLPEAVEKVLIKALARQPQARYQTIAEFAAALEGLSTGRAQPITTESKNRPIPAPPGNSRQLVLSLPRISKTGATVIAVAVAVVALGIAGIKFGPGLLKPLMTTPQPGTATAPVFPTPASRALSPANLSQAVMVGHSQIGKNVTAASYSADGRVVAVAADTGVYVNDATSFEQITFIPAVNRSGQITRVALSPNGRMLATSYASGLITMADGTTGANVWTLQAPWADVNALMFSPDAKTLALAGSRASQALGAGSTLVLWDAEAGKAVSTRNTLGDPVEILAFSPDGKRIATVSYLHIVQVAPVSNIGNVRTVGHSNAGVLSMVFSPDSSSLALGTQYDVKVWNVLSGASVWTDQSHVGSIVTGLAFSPDGQMLASGGADGVVKFWNVADGAEITRWTGIGTILGFSFSPDGADFHIVSGDGSLRLWSLQP